MSDKIHIKSDLSPAIAKFKEYKKEHLILRLNKEQMESMKNMIDELPVYQDDSDLELIILKEVRKMLYKKLQIISYNATIKLVPSQALVLFTWFNDYKFSHPMEESFSREVVDIIYKQVI